MRPALGKFGELQGARRLRQFFRRKDSPSQRELAKRLCVDEGLVYWWKYGHRRPGKLYRDALVRIAGIPLEAWLTPVERAKQRRLSAA